MKVKWSESMIQARLREGRAFDAPQKLVYVAGPMRDIDCFNFPAFYDAEMRLRADGWHVFNPARHDNEGGFDETLNSLDGFDMRAAFRWDVECLFKVDAIYLLKG